MVSNSMILAKKTFSKSNNAGCKVELIKSIRSCFAFVGISSSGLSIVALTAFSKSNDMILVGSSISLNNLASAPLDLPLKSAAEYP